jgi:hypothetical protein
MGSTELEYDWSASFPFLAGLCCTPRQKAPITGFLPEDAFPRAIEEARAEESKLLSDSSSGAAEETPELKSEPQSGSEPDVAEDEVHTDPSLRAVADQPAPSPMEAILPAGAPLELQHLAALLFSYDLSSDAKHALLEYAGRQDGRSSCIDLLAAQVTEGEPRHLLPDAFATIQELMGQLMLDAMQREATEDLRALIKVSHALTLITSDACAECEE